MWPRMVGPKHRCCRLKFVRRHPSRARGLVLDALISARPAGAPFCQINSPRAREAPGTCAAREPRPGVWHRPRRPSSVLKHNAKGSGLSVTTAVPAHIRRSGAVGPSGGREAQAGGKQPYCTLARLSASVPIPGRERSHVGGSWLFVKFALVGNKAQRGLRRRDSFVLSSGVTGSAPTQNILPPPQDRRGVVTFSRVTCQ